MELLKIYKETESKEFKHELVRLIAAIVDGEESFITDNKRIFKELKEKRPIKTELYTEKYRVKIGYKLKITEKLVKKVENYMNK